MFSKIIGWLNHVDKARISMEHFNTLLIEAHGLNMITHYLT